MIARVAAILGLVPRAIRNILLNAFWCCVVVALCVWLSTYDIGSGGMLLLLAAIPGYRKSVLERWASLTTTEWHLVTGVWSRRMLARSRIVELVLTCAARSAAIVLALTWTSAPSEVIAQPWSMWWRTACALLTLHGTWSVAASVPFSARVGGWSRFVPRLLPDAVAPPFWMLTALAAPCLFIVGTVVWQLLWPDWVVAWGLVMLPLLHWLLVEIEPARSGGATERDATRCALLPRKRFRPLVGLVWEGKRLLPWLLVLGAFGVPISQRVFGVRFDESGIAAHMYSGMTLFFAAGLAHFRWRSWGVPSEFLVASGIALRTARRLELCVGAGLVLEMLLIGYLLEPTTLPRSSWIGYGVPTCAILLLCNQAPSPLMRSKGLRVRELFPWFALILMITAVAMVLSLQAQQSYPFVVGLSYVLGTIAVLGPVLLWIKAFVDTGSEEKLRRRELDPAAV